MKVNKKNISIALLSLIIGLGCEFDLPEAGSIPDLTLPTSSFRTSVGTNHRQIIFVNQSNEEATTYIWNFGDGNTQEVDDRTEVTHQYTEDGVYDASLTATDGNGASKDTTITISLFDETPPMANFDFRQLSNNFAEITFVNLSQNVDTAFWSFGDAVDGTSRDFNPIYTYAQAGDYEVTLEVMDELGTSSDTTITISVIEDLTRPVAFFTSTTSGFNVTFNNESLRATEFAWDFGDSTAQSNERDPVHTYPNAGLYQVTLTASGENGTSTFTRNVVSDEFLPEIKNPSFDSEAVRDDNREAWRNTALEASAGETRVLQTSDNSRSGNFAGKLPTAENSGSPQRWLYQEITVLENSEYTISGYIGNKAANVGSTVTFAIYDGPFDDVAVIDDETRIITSADFNAATGHDTDVDSDDWVEASISFNSGSSTTVVLFITNDFTLTTTDSETFLDDFSITANNP